MKLKKSLLRQSGYSEYEKLVSITTDSAMYYLSGNAKKEETREIDNGSLGSLLASTEIKRKKHIIVLDCDSMDGMLAAQHWVITECGCNTEVVESSPGKYWIITDMVTDLKSAYSIARIIPGVDQSYISGVELKRNFYLRASPKISNGRIIVPKFANKECNICNSARKWYLEFKAWFESDMMRKVVKIYMLSKAIRTKEVSSFASNPDFSV